MSEEIQEDQTSVAVEPPEGVADQVSEVDSVTPAETSEGVSQEDQVKEPENRVPVSKIVAEREKKRAAEERAKILEQENVALRQQTVQPQPKPQDPMEGLTEEELVNVGQVKSYYEGREKALNQRIDQMRVSVSTQFARQNHKDFDEVIPMLNKVANPTQIGYIVNSDNPAETAYNFIKASPQYIDSLTKKTVDKTVQETVDTINQHSNRVKTLSNSGAGTAKNKPTFDNMSQEEFDKVVGGVLYNQKDIKNKYFGG